MRGIEAALKILVSDSKNENSHFAHFASEEIRKLADKEKMKAAIYSVWEKALIDMAKEKNIIS